MSSPDPLDVLERIHRDAALLRELAGDSIVITIERAGSEEADEAPPAEQPKVKRQVREAIEFAERVACYLEENGPTRQADLATELDVATHRVVDALRRLGERVVRGAEQRAPGQLLGRGSPVWSLAPVPAVEHEPDPDAEPESDPLAIAPLEPPTAAPADLGTLGPASTPPLSPRTRKSLEREQAEAQAIAALGEPPQSRVFELLRCRTLTIREIAAQLAESQVLVAEEVNALKPWLIQMHDGRLRAVERLREAA